MNIAEQVREPLKQHADHTTGGTRTELCKLLQARMRQLKDPCIDSGKMEVVKHPPDAQMTHPPNTPTQLGECWTRSLQSFKEQMNKQRETSTQIPKISMAMLNKRSSVSHKPKRSQHKMTQASIEEPKTKPEDASGGRNVSEKETDASLPKTKNRPKKSSTKSVVTKKSYAKSPEVKSLVQELVGVGHFSQRSSVEADREFPTHVIDDFDPLEVNVEVEGNQDVDVIKEMREVLEEKQTASGVVHQLEKHMQNLVKSKAAPKGLAMPFWKPEMLKNMTEVKSGLEVVEQLTQKMSQLQRNAVQREVEQLARRRNITYNLELSAYIDVCLHAGLLRKAHGEIIAKELNEKCTHHRSKNEFTITDVAIFNKVMAAWAKQGDLTRIKGLFQQMVNSGVTPTLQSYATILECLGRLDPLPTDTIRQTLDDITASEYDLNNILEECYFQKDEWERVNMAILSVQPHFTCCTHHNPEQYTCRLLSDLKATHQPRVPNPHYGLMLAGDLQRLARQQVANERADFVTVKTILPTNDDIPNVQQARKHLEEIKVRWRECLRRSFKRDLLIEEKHKRYLTGLSTVPYLKLFHYNTYVNLMMQEIDMIALEMESYSPSLNMLQRQFGARVNRYFMVKDRIKSDYVKKLSGAYDDYLKDYMSVHRSHVTDRQCWQAFVDQHTGGVQIDTRPKLWPGPTTRMIGRWLYRLILLDIKIDANLFKNTVERKEIPAFYTLYRQEGPVAKEVIKPHPLLVQLYRTASIQSLTFDTGTMPSLTPPLPWSSVSSGGNLLSTTNLVINPQRSSEQLSKLEALPHVQLNPVFDALNVLSSTPWQINQPILDLIINIFNDGGNLLLDIPQPASTFPDLPKIASWMTDKEKVAVLKKRGLLKKAQQEMHSLWMTELYRLSIASHYRNNTFWFPHNLDFRSRVYATPPHFNHLGSDLARSILLFAEGKKLGPHGLDWLKIHLINLTGFKKQSSNADRLKYANDIFDDIRDSAENPMTGQGWWKKSDEPWQTLACCMEVVQATRHPHPEEYISHYPVHQDGSCNGLQHYAALGRDQAGAESVNLHPFDSPKDVYSDIVKLVEEERKKDAAAGKDIAMLLEGFIQRKVIKQTIMTTVYGVTRFGARLQIEGQLQDIPDFPAERVFEGSLYLTKKTFDCLQMMFTSTKEIQDWFTVCAKMVSSIHYKPMEWETPLGWPVLQPYYRTFNPATLLKVPKAPHIEITNKNRQKNGFPPNFIHSLDSSHMMLTAVRCQHAGVTFVSVHDCFWTHAAEVPTLNKICREEFVRLHSEPILENLASFMYNKYGYNPGNDNMADHEWIWEWYHHSMLRIS